MNFRITGLIAAIAVSCLLGSAQSIAHARHWTDHLKRNGGSNR
jgi:CO dehydrogenase/acetyl-CoA synthase alpha subunit